MLEQAGTLRISRQRLIHNLHVFRRRLPAGMLLCATVKANAYGHGAPLVAPLLAAAGIDWFCVYSLAEALELLPWSADKPILALAPVVLRTDHATKDTCELISRAMQAPTIRLSVTDANSAGNLAALAQRLNPSARLSVHVQIDTGLTRQGADIDAAAAVCRVVAENSRLRLEGLFMHLSHGDVPDHPESSRQLAEFRRVSRAIQAEYPDILLHAQNSGGAWHWPHEPLGMARLGIGLYGLQPAIGSPLKELQPIAELQAPITAIHRRSAGTGVGYGHTHVLSRASRLGVVPVGYADGYPRLLSNRSAVLIKDRLVPVIGRVSMDQTIIDLTDSAADVGDSVTLISDDPASPLCMDALADLCGTIGYELATGLGPRLIRAVR